MKVEVKRGDALVCEASFDPAPGASAFELTVGSAARCDVVVKGADVLPLHARIELRGWHTFVIAAPGATVYAFGDLVPEGQSWRVDDNPFTIGAYDFRVSA